MFIDELSHIILVLTLIIAVASRCWTIRNLRSLENDRIKYPSIRERTWWLVDIHMAATCAMAFNVLLFEWYFGSPADDLTWAYINNINGDIMVWATIVSLTTHAIIREFAIRGEQVRRMAMYVAFAVLIPLIAKTTIYKPSHSYINPDGVIGYAAPSAVCYLFLLASYRNDILRVGTMKVETLAYAVMAMVAGFWFYGVTQTPDTMWQGKLPFTLYLSGSVCVTYWVPAAIGSRASHEASASDNPRRTLIDPNREFPEGPSAVVPTELTISVVARTMVELGRRGKIQQSFTVSLYLVAMLVDRFPLQFTSNDKNYVPRIVADAFSNQSDCLTTAPPVKDGNYMLLIAHYLSEMASLMVQRASQTNQGDDSPREYSDDAPNMDEGISVTQTESEPAIVPMDDAGAPEDDGDVEMGDLSGNT